MQYDVGENIPDVKGTTDLFSPFTLKAITLLERSRLLKAKGQLISEGLFGILNSSKKTNEEIRLNYYDTSGRHIFICFWKNLKTPKSRFEIN